MNQLGKTALLLAAAGVGGWLLTQAARRRYSFAGKVVLITGGSRGLGLVLARELTREGARLAICARDAQELARAAEDLATAGTSPVTIPCDLTVAEQVQDMIAQIETQLGPIDVLINNAGTISVGPISTMTREDFEQALQTMFWAPYNTIEAVLPDMRRRQCGRIVNISSIGGKIGVPHLVPYCTAKFALVGYSQGLRAELADDGIVVTTICPGLMRTGSPRNAFFKGKNEAEYAWFKISDSLPLLTISAETAARQIIEACRRGDAEAVLSLPAQFGVLLQGLFPELTAHLTSLANRMLPSPGGTGAETRCGKESESALAPALVTALTDQAAQQNNELAPSER